MKSLKSVVISACTAFSLLGCEQNTPSISVLPAPQAASAKPVAPQETVISTPKVVVVETPTPAAPPDMLVLNHTTPQVDHLRRARQLVEEGDVAGALSEARRALFSNPEDVETLTWVAKLARRDGKPEFAAEAWNRVAHLQPDDATPLIQQARVFIGAKNFESAVMSGMQATERDSGNAEAYQVTGIAQLALGHLAEAISLFEAAVENNPSHGWALNNLGFACLRANENEKAVEALERAAELLPHVAAVHNNLGIALERTGRRDEAKVAYQQAMDLSPKYVKARLNAARVAQVHVSPEEVLDVPPMPESLIPLE